MELPKNYEPKEAEGPIYQKWQDSGFFNPDNLPASTRTRDSSLATPSTYSIVLPPPNVTGTLHMGHASMLAIQDILIRYHRMKGDATLWLPGTDHAAIATQSKVEKEISKKEGKSRYDLGREELLRRVNEFATQSHDTIVNQMKRMGASLDWSREAFTLDEPRTKAVHEAFKRMYEAGLIYRGHRIVNWDPKGQTTISDDEIVHEEREATLYTFRYGPECPIEIATTRLETKVGDVAIAVHPEGKWKKYIGQTFTIADFAGVPLMIAVVGDEGVDPEFGTGALGVTPAHSTTDWEIAQKNNLPTDRIVINGYAKMTELAGSLLVGKKTTEARELVAQWLRDKGLLIKEEKIKQNISTAERTGGIIEPLPKLQWFVAVNKKFTLAHSKIKGIASGSQVTLKELMLASVQNGDIAITPERFNAVYFHWINNLRDWCISRQIWYGHRIPVWYRGEELHVGSVPNGDGWIQDEDTLDTWFSSGLWTFSTLGWPNQTDDLKRFHPTALLETGYDILFFWVARMILMSGFLLGEVPFKQVYLHGLVRDAKGQKMSKSLGNALDPLELADKYGADATRLSLIIGTSAGNDQKLSEDKVRGYKNFANKIWNISRFVLMNFDGFNPDTAGEITNETDKTAVAEFEKAKAECTAGIEAFNFHASAEGMYHYVWHTFADKVIEEAKPRLADPTTRASAQAMLWYILTGSLKTLHPFMPFVTEEIWSKLPEWQGKTMLMVESW